ncbi:MAG: hypothetical protein AB7P14_24170 [Blastocatellales bacterium]
MLDSLHYQDFSPYINSKFTVHLDETATMDITLIGAEEKDPSPKQEQFILHFQAPPDAPRYQMTFTVRHEQLGAGLMFLVPVGQNESGILLEAVFNRPRQA